MDAIRRFTPSQKKSCVPFAFFGIGEAAPSAALDVVGDTELNGDLTVLGNAGVGQKYGNVEFNVRGSGTGTKILRVESSTGTPIFLVQEDTDIVANGTVVHLSDARLKKNVRTLRSALSKVLDLRGVSFEWREQRGPELGEDIGSIAQEVEDVVPQLVRTDEDGLKSVAYSNVTALLVEAIKELQGEVVAKDQKIATLEARLDRIESLLAAGPEKSD